MNKITDGLKALCVADELNEVRAIGSVREVVKLKRTFNQKWPNGTVTKFWRVVAPITHRNLNSDLSVEGLIEWGIIAPKEII